MGGIGEAVTPVAGIPPMTVLLVNPGVRGIDGRTFSVGSSRADAYPLPPLPPPGPLMEFIFWLRKTRNDLFQPAMAEAPLLEKVVRAIAADPDCVFARMSGSGATVFGIFMSFEAAERAATRLRAAKPHWWVAVTRTGGS